MPLNPEDAILFSGAAQGAEAEFGANAERYGFDEVNFTFEGHKDARTRGLRVLTHEELNAGDVSLTYVSKLMERDYRRTPLFRKVLQSIWHQINNGQQIFVIGKILDNGTVKGGTGWGAEFAKLCRKPLYVFDQTQDGWFHWEQDKWVSVEAPIITEPHFTGTGTRFIEENGKKAIIDLFDRSFE